ncbi:MAG TPA: carboxypeptidase-like regulatory domain-containing protein, partial [Saprospiraceae bacterium]|nr:carboxypeptidase-like regulatory domain-containing protein [Saprospiraceae bacterium]
MMKKYQLLILFFTMAWGPYSWSQAFQTIKGTVVDQQSELPIIGAAVELLSIAPSRGEVSDLDGRFAISNVPVGRHTIKVSYLGYSPVTIPNVLVTAGKETVLNLGL